MYETGRRISLLEMASADAINAKANLNYPFHILIECLERPAEETNQPLLPFIYISFHVKVIGVHAFGAFLQHGTAQGFLQSLE